MGRLVEEIKQYAVETGIYQKAKMVLDCFGEDIFESPRWIVSDSRIFVRSFERGKIKIEKYPKLDGIYVSNPVKTVFYSLAPDKVVIYVPGRWEEELEGVYREVLETGKGEGSRGVRRNLLEM